MIQINLTGRLAADAERKISKTGKEYLSFRIGSNKFNDKDEQGNQKTYWFNVTTFNQRHFGIIVILHVILWQMQFILILMEMVIIMTMENRQRLLHSQVLLHRPQWQRSLRQQI